VANYYKRGLLTPKKAPKNKQTQKKQALKRNEKGKKNRPNIPTPFT
jgi:hypothetical protein